MDHIAKYIAAITFHIYSDTGIRVAVLDEERPKLTQQGLHLPVPLFPVEK